VTKLLYIILGRRILPSRNFFEEEYDDGENPSLFKEKVQETLRKHTDAIINTLLKEPISLITEMLLLEASRGSGYYGRKQHRFQVSKLRSRHHGTYVF
jgi:hypothetical protein